MSDWSWLWGGTDASTNPADYKVPPPHQAQAMGAITQGLATNHVAPQVGIGSEFRSGQINQIGQLQGIASGQQMGAGELAAQRQTQNALAGQQAMARMARGGDASMAARGAARNAGAIGLSGVGMGQQAALSDQMNAQGMLTQALGQGRGQDVQTQIANMDAQLRAMGMNDQARIAYLAQLTGMDQAQIQAQIAAMAAATQQQGLAGPLLSAGGQIGAAMAMPSGGGAMSDERVKTDITDAGDEVDAMLDALMPKAYRYKDQKHGVGRRVGIMAQDLERSAAGRRVVMEVPDGKALDINKALSASLAANARLNARLRKLERKAG